MNTDFQEGNPNTEIQIETKKHWLLRFLKGLKKTLITLFIVVLAFIGLSFVLLYVYEDKIKKIATDMIQKNTDAYIYVQDMNISFIRKFPNASLELEKTIIIQNKNGNIHPDTLARVGSFFLEFNWLDVIQDEIKLNRISLENGYISTVIDSKGRNNFSIFKEDEIKDSTKNQNIISLQEVVFDDMYFTHYDASNHTRIDFKIDELSLKGDIKPEGIQLDVQTDFYLNELTQQNQTYLEHKNFKLNLNSTLDLNQGAYEIKKADVQMEHLHLLVQGSLDTKAQNIDLNFGGDDLNLDVLSAFIPNEQKGFLEHYDIQGDLEVSGYVKGGYAHQIPNINAVISTSNAYFKEKSSGEELEDIHFDCNLSHKNNWSVELPNFSLKLRKEIIQGNFYYTNQQLKMALEGGTELEHLKDLINSDDIALMKGEARLAVKLEGQIPDIGNIQAKDLEALNKEGVLTLKNADYESTDETIFLKDFNAKFTLKNNEVLIDHLKGNFNEGEVTLSGSARHFLSWVFFEDYKMVFTGDLYAKQLNMDRFMAVDKEAAGENELPVRDTLSWPQDILANLNVQVDDFKADEVKMSDIRAQISMNPKEIRINNINANAFDGNCTGNIKLTQSEGFKVAMNAKMNQISFETLLAQMEPFGLESIKSKNLEGHLNATMDMNFDTDPTFYIDESSLVVHFNFDAHQIEIKDWDLINESVAYMKEDAMTRKAIDVDYLAQQVLSIKVPLLSNQITLENGVIFIPQMDIASSLLNIEVGGYHTLEGELNYHLNFRIKEVLEKPKDTEFGYIADDGTGIRVFLKITGTMDNPEISFDRERKKEYQKALRSNEKERLKDILREEFGWFKKKKEKEQKEAKEKKKKEEQKTQFILEGEDEDEEKENKEQEPQEQPWWKSTEGKKNEPETEFIIDGDE